MVGAPPEIIDLQKFDRPPMVSSFPAEILDSPIGKLFSGPQETDSAQDIFCPGPNMEWPPNYIPIWMPEGSGLQSCFISSTEVFDGTGTFVVMLQDSPDDRYDTNIDITSVCRQLGIKEKDFNNCMAFFDPQNTVKVLNETIAPSGNIFAVEFEKGITSMSLGWFQGSEEITLEETMRAFQTVGTMTTAELSQLINDVATMQASAQTVDPNMIVTVQPTSSPQPTLTSTPTLSPTPTSTPFGGGPGTSPASGAVNVILGIGGAGLIGWLILDRLFGDKGGKKK